MSSKSEAKAVIAQLPFPSTHEPCAALDAYYVEYERQFRSVVPEFFVPSDELWEVPLWVAHLTALLDEVELPSGYADLSTAPTTADQCAAALLDDTEPGDFVLLSPLAQNFDLALAVSRALMSEGRFTLIGGNMAGLATESDASAVHRGQLDRAALLEMIATRGRRGVSQAPTRHGIAANAISWVPEYRHLDTYQKRVPLLRVNASHGCLYECSFCGDAWSAQLTMVERDALAREVDDLAERFPDTRLIYIGDKTFGQSKQGVRNLIDVFSSRPGYRFIAQSHVMALKPWVFDALEELGVEILEMGFESADTEMLAGAGKLSKGLDHYQDQLLTLRDRGIKTVLNVMGGLPWETESSHETTAAWLRDNPAGVWLANLYNFVPYPLTPVFEQLRRRITNWDYGAWREDAPVVYEPYHVSVESSWDMFLDKISAATQMI